MGQVLMDSGLASTIVKRDGGKRSKNRRFAKDAILRYKGKGVLQLRGPAQGTNGLLGGAGG